MRATLSLSGHLLTGLRARIAALERGSTAPAPLSGARSGNDWHASPAIDKTWTLGASEIDSHLPRGLNAASLHEVKPEPEGAAASAWAAALGFALRLAVRRVDSLGPGHGSPSEPRRSILWCWPAALAREIGAPYGPGLAFLGIERVSCLFVETARASEALWAMEEGLKSASLALVIGALREAELTPSRRLSLAAAQGTPCLLITDPRTSAAAATATRWRVGAQRSAPDSFDPHAPGAARYSIALERCREGTRAQALPLLLEWSHETHRFRVAPAVADRAATPRRAASGAGGRLPRAG